MFRIFCLAIGYCIGCISSAFLVSKWKKDDIRQKGSGNLGTTNAFRVLGFGAGVATFVGDVFKAVLAIVLSVYFFPEAGVMAVVYAGVGTILGHDFPFYLKFKGGKGIASTLGLILCLGFTFSPWVTIITFAIGLIGVIKTKFISVGSLCVSILMPITCIALKMEVEGVLLLSGLAALATYQHKANIKRLLSGTENKFTFKKSV